MLFIAHICHIIAYAAGHSLDNRTSLTIKYRVLFNDLPYSKKFCYNGSTFCY